MGNYCLTSLTKIVKVGIVMPRSAQTRIVGMITSTRGDPTFYLNVHAHDNACIHMPLDSSWQTLPVSPHA